MTKRVRQQPKGQPPGKGHDPAGWYATCTKMMADRAICGRWYWFVWLASRGGGKRVEVDERWEPLGEPHVCRNGTGGEGE